MSNYTINLNLNFPNESKSSGVSQEIQTKPFQDPAEHVVLEVDDTIEPDEFGRKKVKSAIFEFNADQGANILPITIYFPEDNSRDNVVFTKANARCVANDNFSYTCTFKRNAEKIPFEAIETGVPIILTYHGKFKMEARNSDCDITE